MDYIDKFRKWRDNRNERGDSDSDDDEKDPVPELEDPDWNFGTVRGALPTEGGASAGAGDSSAGGASAPSATGPLESMVLPALEKIRERYSNDDAQECNPGTIAELVKAFQMAEQSKAGFTEKLVQEICTTMLRCGKRAAARGGKGSRGQKGKLKTEREKPS